MACQSVVRELIGAGHDVLGGEKDAVSMDTQWALEDPQRDLNPPGGRHLTPN
jgi:hypothetical protein